MIQKRTVGIVGTGYVGVAAAYAVFLRGLASEIVLVDKNAAKAAGEAMDLMHGQAFIEKTIVRAGDYSDLQKAQLIAVTAGVAQKPGESRLDLLNRNTAVFREIVAQLDHYSPESVLIVATNPVDILTYVTQQLSRRNAARVIGTGTMLDTGRFRALLGDYYDVDPRSVHAYILGEHGDTEVPIWSTANVGGVPLMGNTVLGKPFDHEALHGLYDKVRDAAYEIIDRKGYTSTAIGSAIARLVEAVLDDQRAVLPVSVRLSGQYGLNEVCLSIPALVGLNGVEATIHPELNAAEREGLQHSAAVLKKQLDGIEL
jgi:L-lactate dehydrogenase